MSLLKVATSLLLWALSIIGTVSGAGMTAHNVAARRALAYYKEVIAGFEDLASSNWGAISAGAPFPDYLYTCGPYPGAAEESHWPLFHSAAANYIRANWTMTDIMNEERPQRLVAFLMGMVSHYITDLNWHGLDVVAAPQGFIEQLGTSNFNCSGDLDCRDRTAHKTCDIGGEFVAAWELDLEFYEPDEWLVPVDDLVAIFAYANSTLNSSDACYQGNICFPLVEAQWIKDCAYLYGVGSWAVKEFGAVIWPFWEQTALNGAGAPHLTEAFLTWPVGGMDDDAMWTSGMWNRWESWLENGPPAVIPHAPEPFSAEENMGAERGSDFTTSVSNIGNRSTGARDLYRSLRRKVYELQRRHALPFDVVEETDAGGIRIRRLDPSKDESEAEDRIRFREGAIQLAETLALAAGLGTGTSSESLPETLRVALALHAEELFQGPEKDREVYASMKQFIFPDTESRQHLKILQEPDLTGSTAREYFGSCFGLADLLPLGEGDGCADIVVGSPGYAEKGSPQMGRVSIYKGQCGEVDGADGDGEESRKLFELKGSSEDHARFGAAVATGDLDGDGLEDLVIGAPTAGSLNVNRSVGNYTGEVYLQLSSMAKTSGGLLVKIQSEVEWANFGSSLSIGDLNKDGYDDLVVGAPFAGRHLEDDVVDVNSAGCVFVFFGPLKNETALRLSSSDADIILSGKSDFSWFGSRVLVVANTKQPRLLVSAPAYRLEETNGSVGCLESFIFPSSESTAVLEWRIEGDTWMGKTGFGFAVHQNSATPMIAVSSPTMDGTFRVHDTLGQSSRERRVKHSGQVKLLELKELAALKGSTISWSALSSLSTGNIAHVHGTETYGRLGWRLAFVGSNSSGEKESLLMTAPYANREHGILYEFPLQWLDSGRAVELEARSLPSYMSPNRSSRFGESELVTADEIDFVLVGAPRASNRTAGEAGEMMGSAWTLKLS